MNTLGWIIISVLAVACFLLGLVVRSQARRVSEAERRLFELEETIAEFGPLLADTRSALRKAESRNVRADDLVLAATSITTTADAASKFAYNVATNPVVRVLAWGRGVRRGAEALKTPVSTAQPRLGSGKRSAELPPAAKSGRLRRKQ
jgi:hypothetical protein